MHLLHSSIQPNMEGMNDSSACNPNLWNPPNTMRSLPTDKQAAFNWIDWRKKKRSKKQWCHVTQTLCTYMHVTNRLKITQRGLRQKMPGEDVFFFFYVGAGHWATRVRWESPSHNQFWWVWMRRQREEDGQINHQRGRNMGVNYDSMLVMGFKAWHWSHCVVCEL